ncbi:MAG: GYF domain-containing protein [Planctomycetota bacterium]|nr:GYF domain-containing protein [Planctomycetota bacterium]
MQYYVRRSGQINGPVEADVLGQQAANGDLTPADELAQSSDGPWTPASETPPFAELLPASTPVSPTQPQSLYADERPSLKEGSQWFGRLLLQIVLVAFWIGLAGGAYFVVRTLLDNPNQPDASSVNEGNRPDIPVEAPAAAPATKE